MQEDVQTDTSKKIDKIYQIIEFEIDLANIQISLFKKDNINLILLFLALIGFFAFIPLDVFTYHWFPSAILLTVALMGCIGGMSFWTLRNLPTWNKKDLRKENKNSGKNSDCESCDSKAICESITDEETKEKLQKNADVILIENIGLFFTAMYYTSTFFFVTSLISYFYVTSSIPSQGIESLFPRDNWISILLILAFVMYLFIFLRQSRLIKEGNLKKFLGQIGTSALVIMFCAIIIEIYGNLSNIPPFISIQNSSSQFSSVLIAHSKIIPEYPLTWIVAIYSAIIALIMLEYLFSSKYIEKINQNLDGLLNLKYRIDRYELGLSSDLKTDDILKEITKLKIHPPDFYTFGGIITIPVPLQFDRCEDILYLTLENTKTEVAESQKVNGKSDEMAK